MEFGLKSPYFFSPFYGKHTTRLGGFKDCFLGGGFKYFVFSSLLGEMIQFD